MMKNESGVVDLKSEIQELKIELKEIRNILETYIPEKDKNKKNYKKNIIKEETAVFIEHYKTLREHVEDAIDENMSKETLELAENDIISQIMSAVPYEADKDSKFTKIFQNTQRTEKIVNFLTRIFNYYIAENIKFEDKLEMEGRKNIKYNRNYRSAILLRDFYMGDKDLSEIGLYSEDVHTTGSNDYQHKFIPDRMYLIDNLAPLIFGVEALDIFDDEETKEF